MKSRNETILNRKGNTSTPGGMTSALFFTLGLLAGSPSDKFSLLDLCLVLCLSGNILEKQGGLLSPGGGWVRKNSKNNPVNGSVERQSRK